MKCKLVCPLKKENPEYNRQAHLSAMRKGQSYKTPRFVWQEVGTVIEHRDAWKLVKIGTAVPEDSECKIAAGNLSDDELSKRMLDYQKLDRAVTTGIKKYDGSGKVQAEHFPPGMDLGTAALELPEATKDDDDDDAE